MDDQELLTVTFTRAELQEIRRVCNNSVSRRCTIEDERALALSLALDSMDAVLHARSIAAARERIAELNAILDSGKRKHLRVVK